MIPFGNDVALAMSQGQQFSPPLLLVSDEPRRSDSGKIIGVRLSRWDAAKDSLAKGFPCMVLPDGESVESFAWPKQPTDWQKYWEHSLRVWAFKLSAEDCKPIGEALVKVGFDSVSILCKSPHTLVFEVG